VGAAVGRAHADLPSSEDVGGPGVGPLRREAIFDDLRERWAAEIGPARLEELESDLTGLVGRDAVRVDAPGWMALDDLLEATEPPPG
jgi:hypothetical protein